MYLRFEHQGGRGLYQFARHFGRWTKRRGNPRLRRSRQWAFAIIWQQLAELPAGELPEELTDAEHAAVRFWFKPQADYYIRVAMRFRDLCKRYGVHVRVRFTHNPGRIVFADDLQVAAIGPPRGRLERSSPAWSGDRASHRNKKGRKQLARFIRSQRSFATPVPHPISRDHLVP